MKYLPENSEEAICCISGCGPTFRASDLTIRNECSKNCNSFCQEIQSYIMDKAELSGGVEKFLLNVMKFIWFSFKFFSFLFCNGILEGYLLFFFSFLNKHYLNKFLLNVKL